MRPKIGRMKGQLVQVGLLQDKAGGIKVSDPCALFSQRVTSEPLRHILSSPKEKFYHVHV